MNKEEALEILLIHVQEQDPTDSDVLEAIDILQSHYVNVYIKDLAYGGPEEGGWYYPTYTPEFSMKQPSESDAYQLLDQLGPLYEAANEQRPEISSVASQGRYVVEVETHPARHTPTERPHYE